MLRKMTYAAASAAALLSSTLAGQADTAVEAGVLTCTLTSKSNVVVYSQAKYGCVLKSVGDVVPDGRYEAQIRAVGVDLNFKTEETLAWGVIALTDQRFDGPIEGTYVGASANVALGFGVGTHVLVGGLNNSFALQPISVSGQKGVGASLGVERLRLTYLGVN